MSSRSVRSFVSACVLAALACLVASGNAPGSAQRRRAPRVPPDVLIIGSSSINGALGRLIESEVATAGMHPQRIGHSSSGFSRPDFFDWDAEVPRLGDLHALRGIVIYIGGNDAQAVRLRDSELPPTPTGAPRARRDRTGEWIVWRDEAAWSARYQARVTSFVSALCTGGVPRVVFLLPAQGENEHWTERMTRVRNLQEAGTRATRCGVAIDPSAVRARPGSTVDGVHLSRTGAHAVWDRVGTQILDQLRGTPAAR